MQDYTLVETNAAVYSAIYATHKEQLSVHESFTDIEGVMHHLGNYRPKIDTRWGFKNSDYPLIVCISEKENKDQKEWDNKYYIVNAKKQD